MEQRIVFTGGGTGGHVYPGLAVAWALRRSWSGRITWVGSRRGIEAEIVGSSGIDGLEFRHIPSGKLRRYLSFQNFIDIFKILGGFVHCMIDFLKDPPAAIFSKGGYVTVPPVWAAGLLKIPVISHESDLDPGLATRLNMKKSSAIFVAYKDSIQYFPDSIKPRVHVSGNPIREDLFRGDPREGRSLFPGIREGVPVVVVLGGSLGAVQVNNLVQENLPRLRGKAVIIHQYGKQWQPPGEEPGFYYPRDFIGPEMKHVLAMADLAVARAGAGTLWELGVLTIPGILIPLTAGSRGDQIRNARIFEQTGAYQVMMDPEAEEFGTALESLIANRQKREEMASHAAALPRDAAGIIADRIMTIVQQSV